MNYRTGIRFRVPEIPRRSKINVLLHRQTESVMLLIKFVSIYIFSLFSKFFKEPTAERMEQLEHILNIKLFGFI